VPITVEDTVQAFVDGVPVLECRYGIRNGQYALKVERFLAQEEAEHG
jgi:flagellar motor switch protein FliM